MGSMLLLGLLGVVAVGAPPAAGAVSKSAVRKIEVRIDSAPQQAAVYIDGKQNGIQGYTPLTVKFARGTYSVSLELAGYKPVERVIDVRKPTTVTIPLERAPRPAVFEVNASDQGAQGAQVTINGQVKGPIPVTAELAEGRYLVEVRKDGYEPWSRWYNVAEGERRPVEVVLTKKAEPTGSLTVSSEPAGADLYIDDQPVGRTPKHVSNVKAGGHTVKVRRGNDEAQQLVTVAAGQDQTVTLTLQSALTGRLLVVPTPSVAGAEVYVDGERKGQAPWTGEVASGPHVVEVRAKGYAASVQTVQVAAGQATPISVALVAGEQLVGEGRISVKANAPDARVFVDGGSVGTAPFDNKVVSAGEHLVLIRKDGFKDYQERIRVRAGEVVTITAELKQVGVIKILSTPPGAAVLIDGQPAGVTPTGPLEVSAGEHVVELRANGYNDYKEIIAISGGKERIIDASLRFIPTGPSPEAILRRKRGLSSWGGQVVPPGSFTADVSVGFPYIFEGRLTVGATGNQWLGIDAGVELKTFGQLTEIGVHGRLQFVQAGPLAVAVRTSMAGGGGPGGRNSFVWQVGPVASLSFQELATFSVRSHFDIVSDRVCPGADAPATEGRAACFDGQGNKINRDRFDEVRFFLGAAFEIAVTQNLNGFILFEGAPFQGNRARAAFVDQFNSVQLDSDPVAYGKVGFTLKY
jgi:hypothetical protein